MLPIDVFDGKSQKNKIFEILAFHDKLKAKKTHRILREKYGLGISYQATFKLLNEMVKREILKKEGLEYSINVQWLDKQKSLIKSLLAGSKDYQLQYVSENVRILIFRNLKDFDNELQKMILALNEDLKEIITYWKSPHCWWLIGYPIEEEVLCESYEKQHLFTYALITSETDLDIFAREFYAKKKDYKVKLKKLDDKEVIQVLGDYVFLCEIPDDIALALDKFYKKYTRNNYPINELLEIIKRKSRFELKIIKNKNLAKLYKNQIMNP